MKAYHIDRFGSIGGIVRRSAEDPRPGPKEVLMRVRASSLNYRDLMVLKGGGRGPTKLGVIPLSDGAGDVEAVGEGVTRVKVGDRIAGCFHARWYGGPIKPDYLTDRLGANLDGMLAEYAVLNEEALVHVPSHLSFEEAPTLPCAAVTAWVAVTRDRRVTARGYGPDPGLRGRIGVCLAIRPDLGRPSDCNDIDCREGRSAEGVGCIGGDRLYRDAELGREGA